jgi:large subunit ribosomal protein L17
MRHNLRGRKLGRTTAHREALFDNMVTALFQHERIQTTLPKSKELRRTAEKLITIAKRGGLHSRRVAAKNVRDNEVLKKLFDNIGPRYANRNGGYTRIIKLGNRLGDNAPMSIIELVE